MKSMFNKKTVAIIIMLLLFIFAFSDCSSKTSPLVVLEDRYGIHIELLEEYEVIFHRKDKTFTGVASGYTVVKFKEEPAKFIHSFNGEEGKSESDGADMEYMSNRFSSEKNPKIKELLDALLSNLVPISSEFYPDWNEDYLWVKPDSELYIMYFPKEFRLIFFEVGH